MAKNNNLTDFLTDVANAIRAKKGTTAKINPQNFSSEIGNFTLLKSQTKSISLTSNGTTTITPDSGYNGLSKVTVTTNIASSGGSSGGSTSATVSKSDVNFYDYDGTLLHSYSKSAFLALSALPDLPTREGLTCQGWNYTLAKAKEYVTSYDVLDIGATYITDDGKTRLYIRIAAEGRMTVPLYFSQTAANGVTIDWGDGSATQTLSGTGNKNTTHTYATIGDYVITLKVTSRTLGLGNGSSSHCILGSTGNNSRVYCNMLQAVEIGSGVTSIGNYAFDSCCSLASVVIPNSVTSIGNSAFDNCYSLASVVIPNSVTNIGTNAFNSCYSLASVVIPNSVTNIGTDTFSYCHSLASVVIPNSVTSIGNHVFNSCHSLASVVIPSGVTSIGNNVFYYCYSLASVVIPSGVTSIGTNVFYYCYSLASVVIPNSVTSIGNYVFRNCNGMAYYDFRAAKSVPTLSNTNAFNGIPSDCKIVVPDSLYSSWIAATNWSTYASKIMKASEFNG